MLMTRWVKHLARGGNETKARELRYKYTPVSKRSYKSTVLMGKRDKTTRGTVVLKTRGSELICHTPVLRVHTPPIPSNHAGDCGVCGFDSS